ncbi:MAG: cation:proton antiporter [Terriglobales bacterium]|jgi:CPA2 family monovalent cation:H+ antiporter-2
MPESSHHLSALFVELGLVIVGLAILARLAKRFGISAIPFYLVAGLAFGKGGLAPLSVSENFTRIGSEIGVLLLLFILGLEYTGEELGRNLRAGFLSGVIDFLLNFTPGLIGGLLLRWSVFSSALLGGVTYISSSGIIAKVLGELKRMGNPETPSMLTVLVLEDLAMAIYLPVMAVLLSGGSPSRMATSVLVALVTVTVVLFIAIRHGNTVSAIVAHESDEIVLLTVFGAVLLVAGLAERLKVSSAIGAFLVGIAISGQIAHQATRLLTPLRDLFAATFFFFFGMEVDPATLVPVLPVALTLALITAGTKILTGYWTARRAGCDKHSALRAGFTLIARGEFSIVIAGLGVAVEPRLGPLSAAYVLLLAIAGPILARMVR